MKSIGLFDFLLQKLFNSFYFELMVYFWKALKTTTPPKQIHTQTEKQYLRVN